MDFQPFQNLQDLKAMLDLLSAGRKADNGSYYVHRGDLQWWLFYLSADRDWRADISLLREDGRLLGWTLLSRDENAIDVYASPELRGTPVEQALFERVLAQGSALDFLDAYWIAEDDTAKIEQLTSRGFQRKDDCAVLFQRDLTSPLNPPALPDGFSLRTSRGTEEDARLRSTASYAAFESDRTFDEYAARTWKFMQSPVYAPEHEIFIAAPDGQIAAFCVLWTDELNKAGHFEPIGVHPNFQRRGLGKCLMYDCFRRLKEERMETASVCTGNLNESGCALYEATGFRRAKKLLTFTTRSKP